MPQPPQAIIPHTEISLTAREASQGDIMESYLFRGIAASADRTSAKLTTDIRPGEEKTCAFALIQLLQRFNLESPKVSRLILQALLSKKPSEATLSVPPQKGQFHRQLTVATDSKSIILTIEGRTAERATHGKLISTTFDNNFHAGKIKSDGSIDFRELDRYPSIKAGETIMMVALAGTPKEGIAYDGSPILAEEAAEYPLALGQNVDRIYTQHEGHPAYEVRATKPGVILTTTKGALITSVEVNDRITINEIDFSVGNIGSNVVCPVSMEAGTVHEGFTVNVLGFVKIQTIAGGNIESGKDAIVEQMMPGSRLTALGNVLCRNASSSTITCPQGVVEIQREAIDTIITSHKIVMDSGASLLLNATLLCNQVKMKQVRISGTNRIVLGPGLFDKHQTLCRELEKLKTSHQELQGPLTTSKTKIVDQLKNLSAEFGEDETIRQVFKNIVNALKQFDFQRIPTLMGHLRNNDTYAAVNAAQTSVTCFQRLIQSAKEVEKKINEVEEKMKPIEEKINALSFSISARMRPSALMEIHLGQTGDEPLCLEPPMDIVDDHSMRLVGHYSLKEGLLITERSG